MTQDYRGNYRRTRTGFGAAPPQPGTRPFGARHTAKELWRPGGFWLRLVAWGVDACTIAILVQIVSVLFSILFAVSFEGLVVLTARGLLYVPVLSSLDVETVRTLALFTSWIFVLLIGGVLYNPIFEASPLQATPGKVLLGLYVVDTYGHRCRYASALRRNVMKIPSAAPFLAGFLLAAIRKNGQAFHDSAAGCFVARTPAISALRVLSGVAAATTFAMVTFITIHFETDKVVIASMQRRSAAIAAAPQPSAPPPEARKEGSFGYMTAAGSTRLIDGVFVRLAPDLNDPPDFNRSWDSLLHLQVLLFEEALTAADTQTLQILLTPLEEAEGRIGKRPVALLTLEYAETEAACNASGLQQARLVLHPAIAAALHMSPAAYDLSADFGPGSNASLVSSCSGLEAGQTFSLKTAGARSVSQTSSDRIEWLIRFNLVMLPFRTMGSSTYESYEDALALYNPRTAQLSIALFPAKLPAGSAASIKAAKSLTALPENQPDLIAHMTLSKTPESRAQSPSGTQVAALLSDQMRSGYQLRLFRQKNGGIEFPGDRSTIEIDYPPGEVPKRLYGSLDDGSRIIGRFEGEWRQNFPEGLYRLDWAVPFSAPVIVIE